MNDESRPKAAPEVLADSSQNSASVQVGSEAWRAAYEERMSHWSRGFNAAWDFLAPLLTRAEADRDRYYYELYNSDDAKRLHREMLARIAVVQNRQTRDAAQSEISLDRRAVSRG